MRKKFQQQVRPGAKGTTQTLEGKEEQEQEEQSSSDGERKQQIGQTKVQFLGVILSDEGLQIDPEKVKTICNFDRPTKVRSFLGMTNYCSRFIKGHAELTEPLRKLTIKTEKEFNWNQRCEEALITLKEALASTQNLFYFNPKLKTELIVDASPVGIGAILCQLADDGKPRIIA